MVSLILSCSVRAALSAEPDNGALTLIESEPKKPADQEESGEATDPSPLQQDVNSYSSPNADAAENEFIQLLRKPEEYISKESDFKNLFALQLKPFFTKVDVLDSSGQLAAVHSKLSTALSVGWVRRWNKSWESSLSYEYQHTDWHHISPSEASFLPGATNTHRFDGDMSWKMSENFALLSGFAIHELLFANSSQGTTLSWTTEWEIAFKFGFLGKLHQGKTTSLFLQALVSLVPPLKSPQQDSLETNLGESAKLYFTHRIGVNCQIFEGLWLDMRTQNTKNVKESTLSIGLNMGIALGNLNN